MVCETLKIDANLKHTLWIDLIFMMLGSVKSSVVD